MEAQLHKRLGNAVPTACFSCSLLHLSLQPCSASGLPQIPKRLQLRLTASRRICIASIEVDHKVSIGEEVRALRRRLAVEAVDDALGNDGESREDGGMPLYKMFLQECVSNVAGDDWGGQDVLERELRPSGSYSSGRADQTRHRGRSVTTLPA